MKEKILIMFAVLITSAVVFAAAKTTFYTILDMTNHKITNVATPTSSADAATKAYADGVLAKANTNLYTEASVLGSAIDGKLSKSGGVLNGQLNMTSHRIYNLAAPVSANDAATKAYVDGKTASGGSLPTLALKADGAYPPIVNIPSSPLTGNLTLQVVSEFSGEIHTEAVGMDVWMSQTFPSRTWKVGQTVTIPYDISPEAYSRTNGTLVATDESGALLGRWGVTFPPTGLPTPKLILIRDGEPEIVGSNSSVSLSGVLNATGTMTIGITNVTAATLDGGLSVPKATLYVNNNPISVTATFSGTTHNAPAVDGLFILPKGCEWMTVDFPDEIMDAGGVKWGFDILVTPEVTLHFGQLYLFSN